MGGASTMPTTETTAMSARARPSTPEASRSASASSLGPEQVDEGGHQHRRERPGGDELEEDVGDRARGLVGVAQVGGAEDRGDHPDLDEPHPAGRQRGDAHPRRSPRRSIARHHREPAYGGARVFRRRPGMLGAEVAHPTAVGPCLGGRADLAAGGRSSCSWVPRGPSSLARHALTPSQVAERALLDERRPLTRDEVLAVAALPLDELPDLVALAHRVRLAYCGAEVELESLINAKSGACPEDCAFCSQSARYSHRRRRVPVPPSRRGARGRPRHAATRAPRSSASWSRCAGRRSGCSRRVIEAVDAVHAETGLEVACSLGLLTEEQAAAPRGRGREALQPQPRGAARAVPVDRAPPTPTTTASPPRASRSTRAWSCAAAGSSAWARRSSSASTSRSSSPSSNRARCRSTSSLPTGTPLGDQRADHAARGAPGHRAVPARAAGRVAPPRRRPRVRARRAAGDGPARRRQRADRRQLPHVDRPSAPRRTTRCSRRSACPSPTAPARAASSSTPTARTPRPAQPTARRHPRPRRVALAQLDGAAAARCAGTRAGPGQVQVVLADEHPARRRGRRPPR